VAATTPDALTWSVVAALLAPSRNYWLGTTRPDGSPHAAPVWGVVVDEVLYVYTEVATVKARNLQTDPRAVVHLESGDDVVMAVGTMAAVTDPDLIAPLLTEFAAKYTDPSDRQYLPVGPPGEVVLALQPVSAMTWQLAEYEGSQRRWSASGSGA
jgi:PPOX class probable F420-dependent enzyme